MAIVDIVILVMLVVFVGIGIMRGFANSLLSLCGWFISLIISIFLARPFASLLENILPFDNWIGVPILNWLSQNEFLNIAIPQTESEITTALIGAGIPEFLANILTPAVKGVIPSVSDQSVTLAQIIAPAITHCVVLVIAFIVLQILVRVAVLLVQHLLTRTIEKFALATAIDRTLGGVFGFIKFVLVVFATFMVLTPLKTYAFMDWYEKDVDKSTIGKFVEENNFLDDWLFGGLKNYVGGEEAENKDDSSSFENESESLNKTALSKKETFNKNGCKENLLETDFYKLEELNVKSGLLKEIIFKPNLHKVDFNKIEFLNLRSGLLRAP